MTYIFILSVSSILSRVFNALHIEKLSVFIIRPNPRFIDSESEDENPQQVLVPRRQSPRKHKRTSTFPDLPTLPSPPLTLQPLSQRSRFNLTNETSANSLFDQSSKSDQSGIHFETLTPSETTYMSLNMSINLVHLFEVVIFLQQQRKEFSVV